MSLKSELGVIKVTENGRFR